MKRQWKKKNKNNSRTFWFGSKISCRNSVVDLRVIFHTVCNQHIIIPYRTRISENYNNGVCTPHSFSPFVVISFRSFPTEKAEHTLCDYDSTTYFVREKVTRYKTSFRSSTRRCGRRFDVREVLSTTIAWILCKSHTSFRSKSIQVVSLR